MAYEKREYCLYLFQDVVRGNQTLKIKATA